MQVPTFIELLEEIASPVQVISIAPAEVENLVRVRRMGQWNVNTDGSWTIPIPVIQDAAKELCG